MLAASSRKCDSVKLGFQMPRVFPSAKQRWPLAQYLALGVLFLMAITYEGRYIVYASPEWFGKGQAILVNKRVFSSLSLCGRNIE